MARSSGDKTIGAALLLMHDSIYNSFIYVKLFKTHYTSGMAWEAIIEEWRGAVTKEAISEAVTLASKALVSHVPDLVVTGS